MAQSLVWRFLFRFSFLCSFFFLAALSAPDPTPSAEAPDSPRPTVYQLLPKYGLPSGLLPGNVVNYTLSDDGGFAVELAGPCYVQFEYLVYYDRAITGRISYGSITDLKGVQVKRFYLFWFDVDAIKVDLPPSDSIYFLVGIINKRLQIDQFKTVHSCGESGISASSCGDSWSRAFQLPTGLREVELLLTE